MLIQFRNVIFQKNFYASEHQKQCSIEVCFCCCCCFFISGLTLRESKMHACTYLLYLTVIVFRFSIPQKMF